MHIKIYEQDFIIVFINIKIGNNLTTKLSDLLDKFGYIPMFEKR